MFALTRWRPLQVTVEQVAAVVRAKLEKNSTTENTLLVDVRSTEEVASSGVIPTAVNIPLKMLAETLGDEVNEDEFKETFGVTKPSQGVTQLIFYCAHGVRSAIAVDVAEGLGYSGSKNFKGSFAEWNSVYGDK